MTSFKRGVLCIAIGIVGVLILLVGGGYVSATNGSYWCSVFGIAYTVGFVFPGILVYRSADNPKYKQCQQVGPRPPYRFFSCLIGYLVSFSVSLLWLIFFRSRFFASPVGMHGFTVVMGLALAQLPVLGLGILHAEFKGNKEVSDCNVSGTP